MNLLLQVVITVNLKRTQMIWIIILFLSKNPVHSYIVTFVKKLWIRLLKSMSNLIVIWNLEDYLHLNMYLWSFILFFFFFIFLVVVDKSYKNAHTIFLELLTLALVSLHQERVSRLFKLCRWTLLNL